MGKWYLEQGPEADVVTSSRIRLARNLRDYPFPVRMSEMQAREVMEKVKDAVAGGSSAMTREFNLVDMGRMTPVEKQAMVERHVISPDLAEKQVECGVMLNRDESISVMINEEDHLRIQCLFPGMQLDKCLELCNRMDTLLEEKVDFAFDTDMGYLTCCPTNVGTGIRASVMLHLPALTMTGYIGNILEACNKLGVAVRGIYGENSEASGDMFQISNQVTLGQTEQEMISNVGSIASQIIEQERALRKELYRQNPFRFEDRIFRSLGILTGARIISTEESLKMLSDVRLGIAMGLVKDVLPQTLSEVMLFIQPASLQLLEKKPLGPDERDVKRAELIRKKLNMGKEIP